MPTAHAADYVLSTGQQTWSSDQTVNGAVVVKANQGDTASLTINNGATVTSQGGQVSSASSTSAANVGQGNILVDGSGTRWNAGSGNSILVGSNGRGTLTISNGAQVSAGTLQLSDNGSTGNSVSRAELVVTGQNALLDTVNLRAGGNFLYDSRITVNNGGHINSQQVAIDSVTQLSGNGSRWDNSGAFTTKNDLSLSDGAVLATNTLALGSAHNDRNTQVTVSGQGTQLTVAQGLTLGTTSSSTVLTLANGAQLSAGNGLTLGTLTGVNTAASGALSIGGGVTVDDGSSDYDSVTAGTAQAAGQLNPQTAVRFGAGRGTLAFNHTDSGLQFGNSVSGQGRIYAFAGDTTLSGDLSGFSGSVVVRGGRLVLAGDVDQVNLGGASSFSQSYSRLNVGNGTLVVNGTVGRTQFDTYTNSAQVLAGGVLAGNGQVGSTTVASGGTLSPGEGAIGTLSIQGNLDMAAGSRYAADIAGNGSADRLNVSGTATLRGTQVAVTALDPAQSYQSGQSYTLLRAQGGLVDGAAQGIAYAQAVSNSAFLDVSLQRTATDLNLTIAQKNTTPTNPGNPSNPGNPGNPSNPGNPGTGTPTNPGIFQTVMETANQWNTAGALGALAQSGEPLRLYNNLLILDAASARNAADQLSGDYQASTSTALIANSQVVSGVLGNRLRSLLDLGSLRMPAMALSFQPSAAPAENGAWVQPFGNWTRLGGQNGAGGLRQDTGGVLIGADGSFTDDWRGGVYAGYSRSNFNADDRDASGHSDNYHLGLYTGGQIDALRLSADLGYTWHRLESERDVAFANYSDRLTGKRDAGSLQAGGEAAYRIPFGQVVLEPFAGLSYLRFDADDLHEKGGAAALDLSSDKQDTLFSTLGARVTANTRVANHATQLYGSVGWRRAYGDLTPRDVQSFAGGPSFEVQGVPQARDTAVTEVGATLRLNRLTDVGLSYQGQFGSDTRFHSVNAGLTVRF
ncbi:autotransporter [Pseudomonas oryzihabitans]|nr:autotransporter [Pseudomonas psychrotolerans]